MSDPSEPLTLGSAGHVDHGKSALVKVLTGIDPDRLPEEHARGVSIELGYAVLELPSGRRLSIVDVPGHERYVRTMVAGATGVDLYLMVIAADDGVMPQTREHAAVLRALGIERGVVAVSKADVADPAIASAEAAELLPGAEVVAVSSRTALGLDELRAALDRAAASAPSRAARAGAARLHVDRVFSIRGAGTVVTGTLWSGRIARGDVLHLLGGGGRRRRTRAREVQVHEAAVGRAAAGQRVAVNLGGLSVADVQRGDVLLGEGSDLVESYRLDAELTFEEGAEPHAGERVQIHHGTRESPARLAWLGGRFWQVRLERPLVAARGDRLVARRIAPPDTLGGGVVLDPLARRHGPGRETTARLARLARGEPEPEPERLPQPPPGTPVRAPAALTPQARALEERLRAAWLEPPADSELPAAPLAELRAAGRAVRVGRALHYHPEALAEARRRLETAARGRGGEITLAQLRDELSTSRRFAQALLEHFDSERVTIRREDRHVLRRSSA